MLMLERDVINTINNTLNEYYKYMDKGEFN